MVFVYGIGVILIGYEDTMMNTSIVYYERKLTVDEYVQDNKKRKKEKKVEKKIKLKL